MTAPYYTLLTRIGAAKLANATATNTPLSITQMGVGDANGTVPTPDPGQTSLIHERRRANLNTLKTDPNNPNQIIAEQVIPDNVGGWYIRELGLYDAEGDLIAVGSCPPSYKPLIEEGASREQVIRMVIVVTSDDAVTLKIDPAVVLATREYVDDSIEAHAKSRNHPDATIKARGLVQLSSETDSDDETKAATPKAVKAAKSVADAAVKTVNTHKPDEHGNVKLGSAADADITTSTSDPTQGHVTRVGDGGLLGEVLSVTNDNLADKNGLVSMLFRQGGGSDSSHFGGYGSGVHLMYGDSGDGTHTLSANLFVDPSGNLSVEWMEINKSDGSIKSQHRQRLFGPLNLPTAAQTGAMPYFGTALSVDLNTLGAYSAAGIHYQPANVGATAANHYPVAEAGTLEVTPSAYGCQQEYTTFGTGHKFVRGLSGPWNGKDGPWGPWKDYLLTSGGEVTGTLDQDSVPQATYNQTALSGGSRGGKNCLRKFRGGSGDTIWHETVQGSVYRLATGDADTEDEMVLNGGVSVTFRGEVISGSANGFRIAYGGYGTFWRNDGGHLYLMLTNKNDPLGNYNALRPFYVDLATGDISIGTPLSVSSTITAAKEVTAGYGGPYAFAEQYAAKAAFYNAFATTGTSEFHPVIKQQATVTGKNSWAFSMGALVSGTELSWHLHMKGSGSGDIQYTWDVNGNFTAPGELIPGKWNNFDARYLGHAALTTFGAVGSLAFLSNNTATTIAPGATVAGSSMSYAGVGADWGENGGDFAKVSRSGTPAGTWRCMGYCVGHWGDGGNASLFIRIA